MENPTMGTHDQDTSEVKFDRPIEGERSDGWILKYEPGIKHGDYQAASIITGWPRNPDMLSLNAIVSKADARVIIAAPAMLAMLIAVEKSFRSSDGGILEDAEYHHFEAMGDLIAKATGKA